MSGLLRIALLALVLHGTTAPAKAGHGEALWIEGRLLVATEQLEDPNFERAVVYMVRHGVEGAFGLIVNRRIAVGPLGRLMDSLGRKAPAQADRPIAVYDGGPVAREHALLLHGDDYATPETTRLGNGLALTPMGPALDDLGRGRGPKGGLLIVGHAGWGPGQLEQEIAEGAWTVVDAEADFVLDQDVTDKWRRALERDGQAL